MKKMSRCISVILITVIIMVSYCEVSHALYPTVASINGASALFNAGKVVIPAVVTGAGGISATMALGVGLTAAAAAVAAVALVYYGGQYLYDWGISGIKREGVPYAVTGNIVGVNRLTQQAAVGWHDMDFGDGSVIDPTFYYYSTWLDAEAASASFGGRSMYNEGVSGQWGAWEGYYVQTAYIVGDPAHRPHNFWIVNATPPAPLEEFLPMSQEQLAADIETALDDNPLAAMPFVRGALKEWQKNASGLSASLSPDAVAVMQNTLDSAISAGQAAAVEGEFTPDDNWAAEENVSQVGISAAEMQQAVEQALESQGLNEETLNPDLGPAEETVIPLPEKLSITDALISYVTDLQALPIMEYFTGERLSASGTSTLCIGLPARFGGSVCHDFGPNSGDLQTVGSILLGITAIMWGAWLFKG